MNKTTTKKATKKKTVKKTVKRSTIKKSTPKRTTTKKKSPKTTQKPKKEQILKEIENYSIDDLAAEIAKNLPQLDEAIEPPKHLNRPENGGREKSYILKYTKETALNLLLDIATDHRPIKEICQRYSIDQNVIHKWRILSQSFDDTYSIAMEYRQDSTLIDDIPNRLNELDETIKDLELSPQEKNVRVNALNSRIKYFQWLGGKLNKRYRDSQGLSLNQQITVNAGATRAQSWEQHNNNTKD